MTPQELEVRARELLEQAQKGTLGEDSLVELKETWPEVAKVAPSLAALCNSARGVPVFLLVGVTDAGKVVGTAPMDLATWGPKLEARFDEVAPRLLTDLRVALPEGVVHVLAFDSSIPPYVVRDPDPGRAHERLVQVRRGTRAVDAGRGDLIRMVTPMGRRPLVEALDIFALMAPPFPPDESKTLRQLAIRADLYIAAPDAQASLAFPAHRITGRVRGDGKDLPFVNFRFDSADKTWATVHGGDKQFIVLGAGTISLFAYPRHEDSYEGSWRSVRHFTVELELQLPFDDRPFAISAQLSPPAPGTQCPPGVPSMWSSRARSDSPVSPLGRS